jgi:thiol-disulfide isomerase/thioredoxin
VDPTPTDPEIGPTPSAVPTGEPSPSPAPSDSEVPDAAAQAFDTDFSKRTVSFEEVTRVLPKDRIPAIDEPAFTGINEADAWLDNEEPVLAVEIGGQARAYPVQILMWHEIVNDELAGVPVAVTYCPLCNTGIVFEREVALEMEGGQTRVLDFGTTGRLRFSNLIMYDRQSETWWQQASGKAIAGTLTGEALTFVPSSMIAWGDFKEEHAEGDVLSRETGYNRDYGQNPYVGYDDPESEPFLYQGPETPGGLPQVARVLGVELGGEAVAFPYDVLQDVRVANETVGGEPIVVFWQPGTASALDSSSVAQGSDVGAANGFSRQLKGETLTFKVENGRFVDDQTGTRWNILGEGVEGEFEGERLESIVSVNHFWFSWAAFNPGTRVYEADSDSAEMEGTSETAETELEADFEINLYQGEDALEESPIMFSEVLAGGKPVVLNFWAGLCPICRNELPELQAAYEEYGDSILFVGVDVGPFVNLGSREDGRELLDELEITYPAGSTPDQSVLRDYQVLGTPTTHFILPSGESIERLTGAVGEGRLRSNIQKLIVRSSSS